ncbi:MAG: glycosyl transferase [Planctomycetota bacterium]|nr:glycosyl transferase [Planctomycetota bacterium]
MEDFPAGPASPAPRRPPLSIVIPVYNGGPDFERCLRGVRSNSGIEYEIVVVDDGSTDGSAAVAERFGARVLRNETARGPAAARNAGAEAALAPIVFFLDADVELHPDALKKALARFESHPRIDALFGSYDDQPAAPGLVSRYRNLLHHYVHQQGEFIDEARPAHTFWTGCGAIRRDVFLGLGGFDPSLYRRPAIEDIELGYRLSRSGYVVNLVRDIQATHLKRWTLRSVLMTDIFHRGLPWMLLMLRSRTAESDLNVSQSQRASVAATGMSLAAIPLAIKSPIAGLVPLAALVWIAILNRDFYRFLARKRGWGFAFAAFPLHYAYFCCCGASVALALVVKNLPRFGQMRPRNTSVRTEPGETAVPAPKTSTSNSPSPSSVKTRNSSPWNGNP